MKPETVEQSVQKPSVRPNQRSLPSWITYMLNSVVLPFIAVFVGLFVVFALPPFGSIEGFKSVLHFVIAGALGGAMGGVVSDARRMFKRRRRQNEVQAEPDE